jgi:hypothetical protein
MKQTIPFLHQSYQGHESFRSSIGAIQHICPYRARGSEEQRGTYSFANTPLNAAQAPDATARVIHWDLRLRFDKSIVSSAAAKSEVGDVWMVGSKASSREEMVVGSAGGRIGAFSADVVVPVLEFALEAARGRRLRGILVETMALI